LRFFDSGSCLSLCTRYGDFGCRCSCFGSSFRRSPHAPFHVPLPARKGALGGFCSGFGFLGSGFGRSYASR
jgi:hypothetical protein